jgi:6-phosphogluconolactonase
MNNVMIFSNKQDVAEAAAGDTIITLSKAIAQHGNVTWVLAGGTTPEAAYRIIAAKYLAAIDWSHVTIVIGDERIAPFDSTDLNWHVAQEALLQYLPQATFLRPASEESAENGAGEYAKKLATLPKTDDGLPRFDLVWLGMGEDGHTLSLFPNHPDFKPTDQLVIPVRNSPKPPADRISLTLTALRGARHTIIMATGPGKAEILKDAMQPTSDLPVAQAARITNAMWYFDEDAAKLIA